MQTSKPYILAALALLTFAVVWCESKKREISEEPRNSEQHRQRVVSADSIERVAFQKRDAYWKGRIKTDSIERIAAASKDKAATKKAKQSADVYAKTPNLSNCHTALVDCQEENETKAYSLAVQERMLAGQDSLIGLQGSEIIRLGSVADTLAEGWRVANVNNADLDKQLQKEQSKLRVYATAAFEQHPINNNVKVGATVTHKNKLFSYDKGILQNTHEVKAGVLLRFKK